MQLCLLVAVVTLAALDPVRSDGAGDLASAIAVGRPTELVAGSCRIRLSIPQTCTYLLAQTSADADACSFAKIGIKTLVKETKTVASGKCPNNVATLSSMSVNGRDVDWQFKLYNMKKDNIIGATGTMRQLKFDDIVGAPIRQIASKIGVDLKELNIPGSIADAKIFAAMERDTKNIWLGLGGSAGSCKAHGLLYFQKQDRSDAAVGVSCSGRTLSSFLQKFGASALNLDFLGSSAFTTVLSTVNIKATTGSGFFDQDDDLKVYVNASRGLTAIAKLERPESCSSSFCEYLQSILKENSPLKLKAEIKSRTSVKLSAAIPFNIDLGKKAILRDMVLSVGTQPKEVAVRVNVQIRKPDLLLSGGIKAGVSGFGVEAYMGKVWERAFGLSFLAFGNVVMSVSFIPPAPMPTAFQLGGQLMLGVLPVGSRNDLRIKASAYIGIDTVDPTQNYFYGRIELTVGRLLDAFDIDATLPDVLEKTGFPSGAIVSYTTLPDGKELAEVGLFVPPGLHIKGDLNALGLVTKAEVQVNAADLSVLLHVTLPVLKLGNVCVLKARRDADYGALAFLHFSKNNWKQAKIVFEGYLEVLGMYRYALLHVTTKMYDIQTGGNLFQFEVDMRITADYGSLQTAKFSISAQLKNNGKLKELSEQLREALNQKLTEGKGKLERAQKRLAEAKADCSRRLSTGCTSCQTKFCSVRVAACKTKCSFNRFRSSSWRDRCRGECEPECMKSTNVEKFCSKACKGVNFIGKGLCLNVDLASLTVKGIQKTYGRIVLETLEGLDALDMFDVNLIKFDSELTPKLKGRFSCEVDLTVLKKRFNTRYDLDLDLLSQLHPSAVKDLFESLYEEVKDAF